MKLEPNYIGPCVIICNFNPINLKIQMNKSGATNVVQHNKLKRYEGDNPPNRTMKPSQKIKKALMLFHFFLYMYSMSIFFPDVGCENQPGP